MTSPVPAREKRTRRATARPNLMVIILTVLVWGGLVCGGFYLAKNYIDRSIKEVQETNAMNVQALDERLNSIHGEMQDIKSALAQTDETLSSTNSTRKELNQKIEQLDEQLKQLQNSLKILQESGNVES